MAGNGNTRIKETSLTSQRYEMLAKLGSNSEVLQHIANRFSQKGITLVTPKELEQMIENCEAFESNRLSRALNGEHSTSLGTPSYSDLSKIKAESNWTLRKLDNLEAMIFLDAEQNPLVLYKFDGIPAGDWLSQENQSDKFDKTTEILNDALLASLARQGIIFEDGKLCKNGSVLNLEELQNLSRDLDNEALKSFANHTKVVVLSIEASATNQLARDAESIANPYSVEINS